MPLAFQYHGRWCLGVVVAVVVLRELKWSCWIFSPFCLVLLSSTFWGFVHFGSTCWHATCMSCFFAAGIACPFLAAVRSICCGTGQCVSACVFEEAWARVSLFLRVLSWHVLWLWPLMPCQAVPCSHAHSRHLGQLLLIMLAVFFQGPPV